MPKNVILLGLVSDQEQLAEYYAMADVTVVAGERETFNMPVAESLCCGTPVAGFCAGGPESVAVEAYSRFVSHADVSALQTQICELLEHPWDKQAISREAKEKYAAANMASGYICIYEELLSQEGNR